VNSVLIAHVADALTRVTGNSDYETTADSAVTLLGHGDVLDAATGYDRGSVTQEQLDMVIRRVARLSARYPEFDGITGPELMISAVAACRPDWTPGKTRRIATAEYESATMLRNMADGAASGDYPLGSFASVVAAYLDNTATLDPDYE
jgi:hypothetical protein